METPFEGKWHHIVNDRIIFEFRGDRFKFHCEGVYFHPDNPTLEGTFALDDEEVTFTQIKEGVHEVSWNNRYKFEDGKIVFNFNTFNSDMPVRIMGSYIKAEE